jgi:hypothetical protein
MSQREILEIASPQVFAISLRKGNFTAMLKSSECHAYRQKKMCKNVRMRSIIIMHPFSTLISFVSVKMQKIPFLFSLLI